MQDIMSPCVRQCKMVQGVCKGCGRTLSEISEWTSYTNQEKQTVLKRISKEKEDKYWPDMHFPPINLWTVPYQEFFSKGD